jgi:hypothetical protein
VEGNEKPGVYHFGAWVDDLAEGEKKAAEAGATYLAGRPTSPNSFYECKYRDPDGIVFDITHNGWVGAVKDVVPAKEPADADAHRGTDMNGRTDRVLIMAQGPVGLCLRSSSRKGRGEHVIEQLRDENFLDQVPRAGTNHPATLEMYDDIGLYKRLEPRGIIAPCFTTGTARKARRIAEFDHAV